MSDKLTEQATGLIAAELWLDANPPMSMVPFIRNAALEIISLVEQDVARRLLSDEAVTAAGDMSWTRMEEMSVMNFDEHVAIQRESLQASLTAAGLGQEQGNG